MIAATAATLSLGAMVPLGMSVAAHAQGNNTGSSIVDKIASKFNLNKTDVQKVFDENRATNQAERKQAAANQLATLVKDGKLTQAQADLITAKRAELQADMQKNRDAMKDKTQDEREAARAAEKADIDKWAADNGIDAKYLMPGPGHNGGKGPGGPQQ